MVSEHEVALQMHFKKGKKIINTYAVWYILHTNYNTMLKRFSQYAGDWPVR